MPINVGVDPAQQRAVEAALRAVPNGFNRAASGAVNRTLTTGRSRIVKRIAGEINLKQKDIRERTSIQKASPAKPSGAITLSRKPVDLIKYGARQTKPGVSVKVRKKGAREVLKHTFLATMRSGKQDVFERRGRGFNRARRLPIDRRLGPTVLGTFAGVPGMADQEISALGPILSKNLDSQVDRLLARRRV